MVSRKLEILHLDVVDFVAGLARVRLGTLPRGGKAAHGGYVHVLGLRLVRSRAARTYCFVICLADEGGLGVEGASALCDQTAIALLAEAAFAGPVDRVLTHRKLDSSAHDVEKVHVRVDVSNVDFVACIELFDPRVLRLQNVLLDVRRDSFHQSQARDFPGHAPCSDWVPACAQRSLPEASTFRHRQKTDVRAL